MWLSVTARAGFLLFIARVDALFFIFSDGTMLRAIVALGGNTEIVDQHEVELLLFQSRTSHLHLHFVATATAIALATK